jgi:multidrug efflux pump subunit AcrA (membrane-fusion protein)
VTIADRPSQLLSRLRSVRRAPLAVLALAVAVATLTAAACEPSDGAIATDEVRRATVTEIVDVPASVTARAVATLTAPAEGTIKTLPVTPGAPVEAGTVIAVIDSPAARKRLADARATLAAANRIGGRTDAVDLSGAQADLDAAAGEAFAAARVAANEIADETIRAALLAQVSAAQQQYESTAQTSRSLVRQVQQGIAGIGDAVAALGAAQRVQARAAVDLARAGVAALTVRAPISGVVQFARPSAGTAADPLAGLLGAVGAAGPGLGSGVESGTGAANQGVAGVDDVIAIGDRVSAGAAIVTIVDVSELGLVGEVDETDVMLVSPGITAEVELDAAPGFRYEAVVRSVDLLPTPSARGGAAYRIRLSFADPAEGSEPLPTPRPGMSAVAHLRARTATGAVVVPASAVFTADGSDAVWVVRDGVAAQQKVSVGVQGEELVQVLTGISPGERVVVRGIDQVRSGQELS